MTFHVPEKYRVTSGRGASNASIGNYGMFIIPLPHGQRLRVICSAGEGPGEPPWEHVSVSRDDRCPTWEEMCQVKDLFWSPEDCVIQYHPPHSEYVNNHPHCLHLWRPIGIELPRPPSILVGY